jgi:hypothetical protein
VPPARIDRGIVGRDAIDLDRIEFAHALALQQWQRGDIVEREAEIGVEEAPSQRLVHRFQRRHDHGIDLEVDPGQVAPRCDGG